ncbi:hypothetical protein BDV06DRAFT_118987 [Aspergillus oleicola]
MADVRSLLRSELASRRSTPQSATGTGTNTPNRVTKKRKVDPADSATRKRVKQTDPEQILANEHVQVRPPAAQVGPSDDDDVEVGVEEPLPQDIMRTESDDTPVQLQEKQTAARSEPPTELHPQQSQPQPTVDEDEWAAFEREVAAPTRIPQDSTSTSRPAALSATATISAAPISAEELAALQEKEEHNARQNREAEAEGEREDAARFLEEEFDEMEQLEERVRRLKNMREQLRAKQRSESAEAEEAVPADLGSNTAEVKTDIKAGEGEEEDEDDDDDADDDWDNWRFR